MPYFHVVFTIPEELNVLARRAPRLFYDRLFRAAAMTLSDVARTRLHIQIGALSVLHTWSQTLILHPHIHCVVPGGGFSLDRRRWISVRKPTFFLPVRVLSRRFRTLLCEMIDQSDLAAELPEHNALMASVRRKEWVVYAKPPFGGPEQVLAYLANYTHRIAISNSRIAGFDGERVTFRYRDSTASNTQRLMTLGVAEFLRRFLLHIVPDRFVRIRYYGFMANRGRAANLARARTFVGARIPTRAIRDTEAHVQHCSHCYEGVLHVVNEVLPQCSPLFIQDSS